MPASFLVDRPPKDRKIKDMKQPDPNLAYPFGPLHFTLEKIQEGKKDIWIDMVRLGDIADDEDPKDIAKEIYEVEKTAAGKNRYSRYIEVERPDFVHSDNQWVVRQLLTSLGETALKAISVGWTWNLSREEIDVEATVLFYRSKIREGAIPNEMADLLISNKDERLREVRGELTFLRLSGERSNGHIMKAKHVA